MSRTTAAGNGKRRLLLVATGGTIACTQDETIHLDKPFRILEHTAQDGVTFVCTSPYSLLSEHMDLAHWQQLIDCIRREKPADACGILVLHGSDTLAYTAALLANVFPQENLCLTASDKPLSDKTANGVRNFNAAVDYLLQGKRGVVVSYDGLKPADCITSADAADRFLVAGQPQPPLQDPKLHARTVLLLRPYVGMRYETYSLTGVDAVLHTMYHSATVPSGAAAFAARCRQQGVPCYFVTEKSRAAYESAAGLEPILFSTTPENAYARLLLAADLQRLA